MTYGEVCGRARKGYKTHMFVVGSAKANPLNDNIVSITGETGNNGVGDGHIDRISLLKDIYTTTRMIDVDPRPERVPGIFPSFMLIFSMTMGIGHPVLWGHQRHNTLDGYLQVTSHLVFCTQFCIRNNSPSLPGHGHCWDDMYLLVLFVQPVCLVMMALVSIGYMVILESYHNILGAVPFWLGRHPISHFLVFLYQ